MKKLILSAACLFTFALYSHAQRSCNTFTDGTGLSVFPTPSTQLSTSVTNGELTLTYTNATFWGDEFKWTLPSTIDISGVTSPTISYEVAISSITINGTGCSAVNFVPFGASITDDNNDYSTGTTSTGYFDAAYAAGSNSITTTDAAVDYTKIAAVTLKLASFTATGCTPTSVSAVIKVKNLCVGNNTVTSVSKAVNNLKSMSIFPNPTSDNAQVNLIFNTQSNVKILVQDMTGRVVKNIGEGLFTEFNQEFNTNDLYEGIYSLNVVVDGAVIKSEKLVIQ